MVVYFGETMEKCLFNAYDKYLNGQNLAVVFLADLNQINNAMRMCPLGDKCF